jgi:pseudouridine-5'-phosphate glycosidase
VTVPVSAEFEIDPAELEKILVDSLRLAEQHGVKGKDITPFLLSQMSRKSGGRTLRSNIALLENNARIAAEIAIEIANN